MTKTASPSLPIAVVLDLVKPSLTHRDCSADGRNARPGNALRPLAIRFSLTPTHNQISVIESKPFNIVGVVYGATFTRAVAMSNVQFVHFPARIVEAKLVTWEPADTHEIQAAIKALNEEDQDKLAKSLETGRGVAYG